VSWLLGLTLAKVVLIHVERTTELRRGILASKRGNGRALEVVRTNLTPFLFLATTWRERVTITFPLSSSSQSMRRSLDYA
jgi:hypothetical protein